MGVAAPLLGAVLTGAGVGMNLFEKTRAQKAARKQNKAQEAAIRAQSQQALESLDAQRARADKERRDRLRRSTASARAHFAGRGVQLADGSGRAVIGGLTREAERDAELLEADYQRQRRQVLTGRDLNLNHNLLQRAELKRRERIGLFNDLSSAAAFGANSFRG